MDDCWSCEPLAIGLDAPNVNGLEVADMDWNGSEENAETKGLAAEALV